MRKNKLILLILVLIFSLLLVSCNLTDSEEIKKSIMINPGNLNIEGFGETYELELISNYDINKEIAWESTAPGIATVSDDGVVTTVSAGSTVITASVDGLVAYCVVNVKKIYSAEEVFTFDVKELPKVIQCFDRNTDELVAVYEITSYTYEVRKTTDIFWILSSLQGRKTYDRDEKNGSAVVIEYDLYDDNNKAVEQRIIVSEEPVKTGDAFDIKCIEFGIKVHEGVIRDFYIQIKSSVYAR